MPMNNTPKRLLAQLTVYFWNCQGIYNKKLKLQKFLEENKSDVMLISETSRKQIIYTELQSPQKRQNLPTGWRHSKTNKTQDWTLRITPEREPVTGMQRNSRA